MLLGRTDPLRYFHYLQLGHGMFCTLWQMMDGLKLLTNVCRRSGQPGSAFEQPYDLYPGGLAAGAERQQSLCEAGHEAAGPGSKSAAGGQGQPGCGAVGPLG